MTPVSKVASDSELHDLVRYIVAVPFAPQREAAVCPPSCGAADGCHERSPQVRGSLPDHCLRQRAQLSPSESRVETN